MVIKQRKKMESNIVKQQLQGLTFPAGYYYIGDPCYVLEPIWDVMCHHMFEGNPGGDDTGYNINGQIAAIGGTAYGDGVYQASNGDEIPVDSGCIGIVNMNTVMAVNGLDAEQAGELVHNDNGSLGSIERFDSPFEVELNCGSFRFGHVTVDTTDDRDGE